MRARTDDPWYRDRETLHAVCGGSLILLGGGATLAGTSYSMWMLSKTPVLLWSSALNIPSAICMWGASAASYVVVAVLRGFMTDGESDECASGWFILPGIVDIGYMAIMCCFSHLSTRNIGFGVTANVLGALPTIVGATICVAMFWKPFVMWLNLKTSTYRGPEHDMGELGMTCTDENRARWLVAAERAQNRFTEYQMFAVRYSIMLPEEWILQALRISGERGRYGYERRERARLGDAT